MNCRCSRSPILLDFYQQYLLNAELSEFEHNVSRYYTIGTLERLVHHENVSIRRAAILALGLTGDFSSNSVLASALTDPDRTAAFLAENAIRCVWRRDGNSEDQQVLANLIHKTASGEALKTIVYASQQLEKTPCFAEVWFQRATAWFSLNQFEYALEDLKKTLDLNPFHFTAYVMLGNVYMEIGQTVPALRAFRNALDINPGLKNSRSLKTFRQSTRSSSL